MSLHSIVNFFLLLFFFLPYISKIRGGWNYPQSTKLSVHPRICSNFQPSLEISTPSVCDPCICSMFDDYFFFSLSLSPFFTLDCCVTSWPWSLELRGPRSALSRRVEPETKARRRSMMKNLEKLMETEFRDRISFQAVRCSLLLNAILDIFWRGNYGWRDDSDPAILDFQVPMRWSNNKSWKCWFLNKNHASNICILDCIFYVNKGNKESIQSFPEKGYLIHLDGKIDTPCYSTPLSL